MRWLFILLLAATCQAGWNPALWPSTNSAFKGQQRLTETISALNERIQAAGWSRLENQEYYGTNDGPGWFVQHTAPALALYGIKEKVRRLAPYYLDRRKANNAGNFNTWLTSNMSLPYLTASNLLVYAGAPPDWYDNTPWFSLASHSNGYLLITNILNELRWTSEPPTLDASNGIRGLTTDYTNTYENAINQAISYWIDTNYTGSGIDSSAVGAYCETLYNGIQGFRYIGTRSTRNFLVNRSYAPTSIQASVSYYVYPSNAPYYLAFTNVFKDMSDGVTLTNWQVYGTSAESPAITHTQRIGRLTPDNFVPPSDLIPSNGLNSIYAGWSVFDYEIVIKWDGPNGFKYK
jgi:hypothetical protein